MNGWLGQCRRHRISAELIVVEWNPPADRPRLAQGLEWDPPENCPVRIIEVPASVHAGYRHAEALPLYQMIGKNVGIRRRAGRFVLATNIDVLFSDELAQFLAARQLDAGRLYRIDRHDAMSDVPVQGVEDQLAYCATHLIRINSRHGAFPLTPGGARVADGADIATGDSGAAPGDGWFPPEVRRWGDVSLGGAAVDRERAEPPRSSDARFGPGSSAAGRAAGARSAWRRWA